MSWTFSYPFSNDSYLDANSEVYTGVIGTDIWIIADIADIEEEEENIMKIFVFNTETCEVKQVDFETPIGFKNTLEYVVFNGDQIYLWRKDYESEFKTLFKFDTKKEEMTYIVTIESKYIDRGCPIIDDHMYTIEVDRENETISMNTISLSRGRVVSKHLLKRMDILDSHSRMYLMLINGQLYLLEMDLTNRFVFKIDDYKAQLLSHCRFDGQVDLADLGRDEGLVLYHEADEGIYKDVFDFEQLTWNSEIAKAPNTWEYYLYMDSFVKVNGNIYAIIDISRSNMVGYEVRVFEKMPKLSTICYVSIVETCLKNDRYELERIREMMPDTMRSELDGVMNWRKEKNLADFR